MKIVTHQTGMSLVELMVAITLSLILMAGVIQIHVSSKVSYETQHQISELQQNQMMAVELLNRDIRQAGLSKTKVVPNDISGLDGDESNAGDPKPDEITIRYESDKDCLGDNTDVDPVGIATNRYFIQNGALLCQILYGEDTDTIIPGAVRTANRYVKPTVANMANVVSVRIALLMETSGAVRGKDKGSAVARKYILLDTPAITFSDQKRREIVTTTVRLRNVS
jgi:prepilin-type N-terminal cleavage/methylation domain-containing protein